MGRHSRFIKAHRHVGKGDELFNFRGKQRPSRFGPVVERAHGHGVARGKEALFRGIPDGKGKITDEMRGAIAVPALIGRQNQVGVRRVL